MDGADGPSLGTRPAVNQTTKFLRSARTTLGTPWKVLSKSLSLSLSRFFDAQGCNYASGAPSRVWRPPSLPFRSFRPRFSTEIGKKTNASLRARSLSKDNETANRSFSFSFPFLVAENSTKLATPLPFSPIFPIFRYSKERFERRGNEDYAGSRIFQYRNRLPFSPPGSLDFSFLFFLS